MFYLSIKLRYTSHLLREIAGFLIDFISGPVNSGFTSAVAILIVASQIKDIIGVKAVGSTLLQMIVSICNDINNFQLGDTLLGVICIAVILLLRVSKTTFRSVSSFKPLSFCYDLYVFEGHSFV